MWYQKFDIYIWQLSYNQSNSSLCMYVQQLADESRIHLMPILARPDLNYSVDLLSQFIQNPQNLHLNCIKRILRYVSTTMDYNIMYKSNMVIQLEGYTDANWAGYNADRRSTSGFLFSIGREQSPRVEKST